MTAWRSGQFDRARLSAVFHPFTPAHAADNVQQIDLDDLWAKGKRLILLDIDNTLVQWRQEKFAGAVLDWIKKAKSLGFDLCVLSNTRRVERLKRISEMLGVDTVRGRFKPSRAMYRLALIKFHRKPEEAIMIGDQLMTDVLGANRSGIEAIWVRRMEGKEFGPTSINRFMERLLSGALYKALITPIDEQPQSRAAEAQKPLKERTLIHQLIRFAIVGGIAFVIDYCVRTLLMKVLRVHNVLLCHIFGGWLRETFPWLSHWFRTQDATATPVFFSIAAVVAMFFNFLLNRSWTFQVKGKEQRLAQLRRFYFVSIPGSLINVGLSATIYNLTSHWPHGLLFATVIATGVAAVWNFLGQRFYAFRHAGA